MSAGAAATGGGIELTPEAVSNGISNECTRY